ncbi:hypothetical protein BJ170DRAFT_697047 [Xylariales sp. AK1849]|nr:hypothetical protein BJ170DRAFT_697047 [Xylariales sp. AK1849]
METKGSDPQNTQATASAPNDNTGGPNPTKLSIRAIPDFPAHPDRNVDLEHGPLLRYMGDGHTNDEAQDGLQLDTEHGRDDPVEAVLVLSHDPTQPRGELLQPYAPPMSAYSEQEVPSEPSHGRSFSVYTANTSSTRLQPPRSLDTNLLSGMQAGPIVPLAEFQSADVLGERATETYQDSPSIADDALQIFPWKYKFSWEWKSGRLLFASEPLSANSLDHPIKLEGSSVCSQAGDHHTPSDIDEGGITQDPHLVADVLYEFRQRVVDILRDDYWRTRGPQRSDGHHSTVSQSSSDNQPYGSPLSKGVSKPSSRLGHRRGTRGAGARDDESDDGSYDLNNMSERKGKKNTRRVDCPFLRYNPNMFGRCRGKGFLNVSHLKEHLREKHQEPHCGECLQSLNDDQRKSHKCLGPGPPETRPRRNFLTKKALAQLENRARNKTRNRTLEDQWVEIYKIIFPDERQPYPNPYLDHRTVEIVNSLERYIRTQLPRLSKEFLQIRPPCQLVSNEQYREEIEQATETFIAGTLVEWKSGELSGSENRRSLPDSGVQESVEPVMEPQSNEVSNLDGYDRGMVPTALQPQLSTEGFTIPWTMASSSICDADFSAIDDATIGLSDWNLGSQGQFLPGNLGLDTNGSQQGPYYLDQGFVGNTSEGISSMLRPPLSAPFDQFDVPWHPRGLFNETGYPDSDRGY